MKNATISGDGIRDGTKKKVAQDALVFQKWVLQKSLKKMLAGLHML